MLLHMLLPRLFGGQPLILPHVRLEFLPREREPYVAATSTTALREIIPAPRILLRGERAAAELRAPCCPLVHIWGHRQIAPPCPSCGARPGYADGRPHLYPAAELLRGDVGYKDAAQPPGEEDEGKEEEMKVAVLEGEACPRPGCAAGAAKHGENYYFYQ